jgi:polysaccharide export outer membrane protein
MHSSHWDLKNMRFPSSSIVKDVRSTGAPRILGFCLVFSLVLGLLGSAFCQEDYRLGPEDELEIRVWSHDDLTRKTRVGLNGTISFPFVGEIRAQGLSLSELQKQLEGRLGPKYIVDPHVSVVVTEYKSQKFFVVGNVQKPGTYPLTKPIRVVEAISQAGGITSGTTGKSLSGGVAIIIRAQPGEKLDQPKLPDRIPAGQKIIISLSEALAGDPKQNVEIKTGDTVYVPNLIYYVAGEVKRPGRYPFEDNMTVLMAVTTAEGFTDKASSGRTYIIREQSGKKQKIKVGMDDLIRSGDTIVVPESWF